MIAIAAALLVAPCHAQNIDAGKSPAQIFADTCATCHRSARELKRPSAGFLRQHYMASSAAANAMANYLSGIPSDVRAAQPKRPPSGASTGPAEAAKQQANAERAKSTQVQAREARRPAATAEAAGPSQAAAAEETRPAVLITQSPTLPVRIWHNQFWAALAGVFLLFAIGAIGSAVYAWRRLKANEDFLKATLRRVTEIADETVAQAEKYGVPRDATLTLLGKSAGVLDDMARYGRQTPQLRYRTAWMLIQFARNFGILGNIGKQFARANEAYRLLARFAVEKSDDIVYQWDLTGACANADAEHGPETAAPTQPLSGAQDVIVFPPERSGIRPRIRAISS
jgi:hypothetical protein